MRKNNERELLEKLHKLPDQTLSDEKKARLIKNMKTKSEKNHMKRTWTGRIAFAASLIVFPAVIFAMFQILSTETDNSTFQVMGHTIDTTPSPSFEGDSSGNAVQIVPVEEAGYYSADRKDKAAVAEKTESLVAEHISVKDFKIHDIIQQESFSFAPFQYVDEHNHLYIGAVALMNRDDRDDYIHQIFHIQVNDDNLRAYDNSKPEATALLNWEQHNYFLAVGWTLDTEVTDIDIEHVLDFDTMVEDQLMMAVTSFTRNDFAEIYDEYDSGQLESFKDFLETDLCRENGECYTTYFLRHPELPFPES